MNHEETGTERPSISSPDGYGLLPSFTPQKLTVFLGLGTKPPP